jgi:hypothetical protein
VSIESSHHGGRPEVATKEGERGFGAVSDPQWTPITAMLAEVANETLQINQCEENRVGSDACDLTKSDTLRDSCARSLFDRSATNRHWRH